MYLFIWKAQWWSGKEQWRKGLRKRSSIHCYIPQKAAITRSKPRAWNSIQISHMGGSGPSTWATICCILRHRSRDVDPKWSIKDLNCHSHMGWWHYKQQLNQLQQHWSHVQNSFFSVHILHALTKGKWFKFNLSGWYCGAITACIPYGSTGSSPSYPASDPTPCRCSWKSNRRCRMHGPLPLPYRRPRYRVLGLTQIWLLWLFG